MFKSAKPLSISFEGFCMHVQSFRQQCARAHSLNKSQWLNIKCVAVKAHNEKLHWNRNERRICWYVKLWSSSLGINFLYYSHCQKRNRSSKRQTYKTSWAKNIRLMLSHRLNFVAVWTANKSKLINVWFWIRWKSMSTYCAQHFTFILLIVLKSAY